jgi:hypothetical protein
VPLQHWPLPCRQLITQKALSCRSPTDHDAALGARIAAIRGKSKLRDLLNIQIAVKPDFGFN